MTDDPFTVLGLDRAEDLGDDDVRAAWRRVAAATHPDRADGGDPRRFATAAAAYTELRTKYGRGEARASLERTRRRRRWRPVRARLAGRSWLVARLALRVIVAASAAALGVSAAGHGPAGPALAVGAATWLAVTAWRDAGWLAAWRGQPGSGQPGSLPVATGRLGSADQADHEPT